MAGFGIIGPQICQNATIVTPGTLAYSPSLKKLFIGGAGTLAATMSQSGTIAIPVTAGEWVDLSIVNVGTATTATNIIGFW